MLLKDIIKIIENEYPKNLACSWDNVGLLAGNEENDIKTVLVTLDITPKVVDEAIKNGADLILSHHPLLFGGVKSFCEDNEQMKMYTKIIRNNISVYSAHTNMDTALNGINQKLAELFSLSDIGILENETGLGRYGDIPEISLNDFCEVVKKKLNTPFLKVSKNSDTIKSDTIVRSVIDLARKLKMKTVSEGIEYKDQVEFLKEAKCDMIQGYYFSKPIPITEFEKLAFGLVISGKRILPSESQSDFVFQPEDYLESQQDFTESNFPASVILRKKSSDEE